MTKYDWAERWTWLGEVKRGKKKPNKEINVILASGVNNLYKDTNDYMIYMLNLNALTGQALEDAKLIKEGKDIWGMK